MAVVAVVHLLAMPAPANCEAVHAVVHSLAQTACIDLHAACHALQKPLVAAAMSSPCQVTARHDGRAPPVRVAAQAGGKCWSRWQVLEQAAPACTAPLWVNHTGQQLVPSTPALRQHVADQ